MTTVQRNKILAESGVSLNAAVQAAKRRYKLSRSELLEAFAIPPTPTSVNRYWCENYNITKWEDRNEEETKKAWEVAALFCRGHKVRRNGSVYNHDYYMAHKQKYVEANKRWRDSHREHVREYLRNYQRDYKKGILRGTSEVKTGETTEGEPVVE